MQTNPETQIPGWGVDTDPANDPTYPMRRRDPSLPKGLSWQRPPLQPVDVEVLHSNERPDVTAVFGDAAPPAGVSGMLRRFAFKYSESSYGHWLPLMLADRIGMIEGVIDDVRHGHPPNVFSEMGLIADWKHSRTSLVAKCLLAGALTGTAVALLSQHASKKRIRSISARD
jgi:hypothetical protein